MKKLLLPLLALTLSATAASAQMGPGQGTPPSPDAMATRQTEGLSKGLGLNAEQTAKVQQIMLARAQEMQTMRGQMQPGADRSQMREQMQTTRAKYDDQLKAVLTPDQFTKYTAMEANRMGGRGMGNVPQDVDAKVKEKGDKVKIKAKSE